MSSRIRWVVALGAVVGVACAPRSGTLDLAQKTDETVGPPEDDDGERGASVDDDGACRSPIGTERRQEVCRRWTCDTRDATREAAWDGDPVRCERGSVDPDTSERALRLINVRRFLAGLAPVAFEPSWTKAAQECALVGHVNEQVSHHPPSSWRCWSETASRASAVSLIANRSAGRAIAAFFEDPGNELTMGHRRWLLSESLAAIGVGSTDRYACVVVDGSDLDGGGEGRAARGRVPERGWVAWPPPGPVPIDIFRVELLDARGWTVQSRTEDLDVASVSVTTEGIELAVKVSHLAPGVGSRSALSFVPDGWTTEAGRTYEVSLRGGSMAVDFTVEPIECP